MISDTAGNVLSLNINHNKAYLSKFSSQGDTLWERNFGNSGLRPYDMSIDAIGNLYITGAYSVSADLDPSPTQNYSPSSIGITDIFISKIDTGGNLLWGKIIGGLNCASAGFGIDVGSNGHVYTTGYIFGDSADFDPDPLNSYMLKAFGNDDGFISELDASGNFVSAITIGRAGQERAMSIFIDDSNFVYVTGHFHGNVDFKPGPGMHLLSSTGLSDGFITKLDSSLNLIWVKQIEGASTQQIHDIKVDDKGNVFTIGLFQGTTDFDPSTSTFTLAPSSGTAIFIHKLNSAGNFEWVDGINLPTTYSTIPVPKHQIGLDTTGAVYSTGHFYGAVDFNPGPGVYQLSATSSTKETYILKLGKGGDFKWATQFAANTAGGKSQGQSLVVDKDLNVYSSGTFYNTIDFDPGSQSFNLNAGSTNMYLQKMSQCMNAYASMQLTACDSLVSPSGKHIWKVSGNYYDTLSTSSGCDSILNVSAVINPSADTLISLRSCSGFWWPVDSTLYNQSGRYQAVVKTYRGCDSVVTLDITIDSVDLSLTNNDPKLEANETFAAYQWINCDSNYAVIPWATSRIFTPIYNGNYAVIISKNSCVDTSTCVQVSTIDLKQIDFNPLFKAYPNPTSGIMEIRLDRVYGEIKLEVFDSRGRLVNQNIEKGKRRIELSIAGKPGFYFLRLTTETHTETLKVVKE